MLARLLVDKGVREYIEAARIDKSQFPNAVFQLAGRIDSNPSSISFNELNLHIKEGFIEYLGESEIPFCIVFTKADKLGKTHIHKHVEAYKKILLANDWAEMPQYFITSAESALGKEEILTYIDDVNQNLFTGSDF
jgi:GTP-binding protein EngB required for normal cell division